MSLRLNLTWHVVWVLNSSSDARGLLKSVRMIPLGFERTILLIFVTHPCLPTPSLLFAFRLLFSCSVIWLFATQPHGLQPARLLSPWDFAGKNMEWVVISFFRGSSWSRHWTQTSCFVGRLFTTEPPGFCVQFPNWQFAPFSNLLH